MSYKVRSNYKRLGDYIQVVNERNRELEVETLLGVSIQKVLMPSIANTIGTNMTTYKIIKRNQFAYGPVTSRNGDKISIALLEEYDEAIVSQMYTVFEVIDKTKLNPEYLMMWFRRPEFDRYARFKSHGSTREVFNWEEMCEVELPIPSIEKQNEIVKEYNTIVNRIELNETLNQKLEETAQALYKHWFVDFEFPNENGEPYKSSGGEMVYNEKLDIDVPVKTSVSNIGKYAKVKSGFAFKSKWWQHKGVPVIKIGSIYNNSINFNALDYVEESIAKTAKNYKVKYGDIVIAMTGATIGKVGIIPSCDDFYLVNQRVGMFDLGDKPILKAPFLYFSLLRDFIQNEIRNVGGDSAQANISNSQIENMKLIFPNKKTVTLYNHVCRPILNLTLHNIYENLKLSNYKDLLLAKMTKA